MELPTSNRKKVIGIWLTGLVTKIDPFSIFWKVISRKPLDLHRWKFAQIFFQALSASVPNFIEIGGGSRKLSKKLVDLTRNDPNALALDVDTEQEAACRAYTANSRLTHEKALSLREWFRNLVKRNVVRATPAVVELTSDWLNRFTRTRGSGLCHQDWVIAKHSK